MDTGLQAMHRCEASGERVLAKQHVGRVKPAEQSTIEVLLYSTWKSYVEMAQGHAGRFDFPITCYCNGLRYHLSNAG